MWRRGQCDGSGEICFKKKGEVWNLSWILIDELVYKFKVFKKVKKVKFLVSRIVNRLLKIFSEFIQGLRIYNNFL